MSNNKQSSVEQFAIALYENGYLQGNGDEIDDLLVYFKAMHKKEIERAYWHGGRDMLINEGTCEKYYEQTYGGNK